MTYRYIKRSNRLYKAIILLISIIAIELINYDIIKSGVKLSSGVKFDNPLPLYGNKGGNDIVIFILDSSSSMQDYGIHEQTEGIAYWDSDRFKDAVFSFANVSYGKKGQPCSTCRDYAKETGIIPVARFISDLPFSMQDCLINGDGYCNVVGSHNDSFTGAWAALHCNVREEPCNNWQQNVDGVCTGIFYPGPANLIVMKAAMMRMLEQFNGAYKIAAFTASDSDAHVIQVCGNGVVPLSQHGLLFDVDETIENKKKLIQGLHAVGNASLSEILYEVYRYLRGENSYLYPELKYNSPIKDACDRIHIIVISDGVYEKALDTPPVIDLDGDGILADEIAYKLANEDLSKEYEGEQKAQVHSIYYILKNAPDREYRVMGQTLMRDVAQTGDGNYYEPSDMLIIEDKLGEVVGANIRTRIDGYTAGTRSWDYFTRDRDVFLMRSNTFNNLGSTDKYLMQDGIIEAIYPDVEPLAESGKKLRERSYQSRKIYTVVPDKPNLGVIEFKAGAKYWDELRSYLKKVWGEKPLGLTIEDIVDYIRGNDYYESWQHGNLRSRCWYGDCGGWKQGASWESPVFSSNRPLPTGFPDKLLEEFADEIKNRRKVVFVPANNGMIHCFNASNMEELWAFIPPGYLKELLSYAQSRWYRKDLTPRIKVFDLRISTPSGRHWDTFLIGVYGLTINGVFALKVTSHQKPEWLWEDFSTGFYAKNTVSYYYQMLIPGYPNKQGDALLIIPTGYGTNYNKKILIKHPLSGNNVKEIDLDDGQPGNEDSEIAMIQNKIFACNDPMYKTGDVLVYDNRGKLYDLSICNSGIPIVKSISKPTPKDKEFGMWNMLNGKYLNAGLNYVIAGDGILLTKEHLNDLSYHSISISAPHNSDFPVEDSLIAKYEMENEDSWVTIAGGDKSKKHILINLPHAGERALNIYNSNSLSQSYQIIKTVYYEAEGCEAKIPNSSLIVIPRMNFSIIKNQPWIDLRSEYLNHENLSSFIDINGDRIIDEKDVINGKKVYGKSFDGYIAEIIQQSNIKDMVQHYNIILIDSEPDNSMIYRSRIEHIDVKVEPSYEIIYKKVITLPKVDKVEYPEVRDD